MLEKSQGALQILKLRFPKPYYEMTDKEKKEYERVQSALLSNDLANYVNQQKVDKYGNKFL